MRAWLLSVSLLLACGPQESASSPSTSAANTYETDHRQQITSTVSPWSAIGRLTSGDEWCTASLIAPDYILTAAHCFMDTTTHKLASGPFTFYPQYANGAYPASSTVNYIWWGTTDPNADRPSDWAIGRLDDALGNTFGWLGTQSLDMSKNLTNHTYYMAGYSEDFDGGDVASWESGCVFAALESNGLLLHDCDMSPGASGGPMFYYQDPANPRTSARIVAINVAEYTNSAGQPQIGVPFSTKTANIAVPTSTFEATLNSILAGQ